MKYLAFIWSEGLAAPEELAVMRREISGYVAEMERRGVRLLGRELQLPETAATVRVRDGQTLLSYQPATGTGTYITGADVVTCTDRQQAIELAAAHPAARDHVIEVRPFYTG